MTADELIRYMTKNRGAMIRCESVGERLNVLRFFSRNGFSFDETTKGYLEGDETTQYMHPAISRYNDDYVCTYVPSAHDPRELLYDDLKNIFEPLDFERPSEEEFAAMFMELIK